MITPTQVPIRQWVKFALVSVVYILFVCWLQSYGWLVLLLLIFDLYITRIIPWGFWKGIKNKTLYSICSWIDAILFALVAVYFINVYIFQNYKIPSSSLEKTLLVGDYLVVSKAHYGPRVPMTPLSFPLAQHTLPILNCKSYVEHPQWEYRRLAGLDSIRRMDIVVFNFPTGDTVATLQPNPDYYTLCHLYGRETVWGHPEMFGEIVYRPVDRRENYVKRCVGLPGDSLQIIDNHVYINGKPQQEPAGMQLNYFVETDNRGLSDAQFEKLNISIDDRHLINRWASSNDILSYLGYTVNPQGEYPPVYYLPLTAQAKQQLEAMPNVKSIQPDPNVFSHAVFPVGYKNWTRDNYGPIYIPRKGATVALTPENLPLYERIIRVYEKNTLELRDSVIYLNGQPADSYTFRMNYYWMMGDNRHNSEDSRFWGYVPEDHIVGTPLFIWLSIDKDQAWYNCIRWSRLFTAIKNLP